MNKRQATLFQSWGKESYNKANRVAPSNKRINKNDYFSDKDVLAVQSIEINCEEYQQQVTLNKAFHPYTPAGRNKLEEMADFDFEAGKSWIYPTNYPVREYQLSIVQEALFKNTMVVLPTGLGKTFIAAVLLYNFYRWYPQGKVVFMAPTKPLVAQQIEACFKVMGIPQEHTAEMTGTVKSQQRAFTWQEKRVFFLTPQVMANDLSRDICPASNIKCVVIDEAHKALGNHAYCQVVKELQNYTCNFRVLALSATPGSDLKAVRQVLQNLLISHVELRTEDSSDIKPYIHNRIIEKIVIKLGEELTLLKEKFIKVIEVYLNRLAQKGAITYNNPVHLSKFQVLKLREAFNQNPSDSIPKHMYGSIQSDYSLCISLYHAYELLLHHGKRSFYNFLKGIMNGEKSLPYAKTELLRNPNFEDIWKEFNGFHSFISTSSENNSGFQVPLSNEKEIHLVNSHPKLKKLQEIVLDHFKKNQDGDNKFDTRVMIFSQYRESVHEIKDLLSQSYPLVRVMTFIGQTSGQFGSGFSQKQQLKVVRDFREGGYNTLVSTCVGEEGLDIGEVDLIICYDASKSPVRLVQRMGRTGRLRQGRIVVLVTEGKEEQMYNQSQYNKLSIFRNISKGAIFQNLYIHSPRMIPEDINPVCKKIFIDVKKYQPTETIQFRGEVKKHEVGGCFLTDEELSYWSTHFKVSNFCTQNLNSYSDFISLTSSNNALQIIGNPEETKNHLNLSLWTPWQNTLQDIHFVTHSCKTKMLVDSLEKIMLYNISSIEKVLSFDIDSFLQMSDISSDGDDHVQRQALITKGISNKKQKSKTIHHKDLNYSLEKYCKISQNCKAQSLITCEQNNSDKIGNVFNKNVASSIINKKSLVNTNILPEGKEQMEPKNDRTVEIIILSSDHDDDDDFQSKYVVQNSKKELFPITKKGVSLSVEDKHQEMIQNCVLSDKDFNVEYCPLKNSKLLSDQLNSKVINNLACKNFHIKPAPTLNIDLFSNDEFLSPVNIESLIGMSDTVPLLKYNHAPLNVPCKYVKDDRHFRHHASNFIIPQQNISDLNENQKLFINDHLIISSDNLWNKFNNSTVTSTPKSKTFRESVVHSSHSLSYNTILEEKCLNNSKMHDTSTVYFQNETLNNHKDVSQYSATQLAIMLNQSVTENSDVFQSESHMYVTSESLKDIDKKTDKSNPCIEQALPGNVNNEGNGEFIQFDLMFDIDYNDKQETNASSKVKQNHLETHFKIPSVGSSTSSHEIKKINFDASSSKVHDSIVINEKNSITKTEIETDVTKQSYENENSKLTRLDVSCKENTAGKNMSKLFHYSNTSLSKNKKNSLHSDIARAYLDEEAFCIDEICTNEKELNHSIEDYYESSFIDDSLIIQNNTSELKAMYLQSVQTSAGLPQRFKLQYNCDNNDNVYSQPYNPDLSDYEEDSFCVNSATEFETDEDTGSKDDFCVTNKKIQKKKKTKFKRIATLAQSSSDNEDIEVNKRENCDRPMILENTTTALDIEVPFETHKNKGQFIPKKIPENISINKSEILSDSGLLSLHNLSHHNPPITESTVQNSSYLKDDSEVIKHTIDDELVHYITENTKIENSALGTDICNFDVSGDFFLMDSIVSNVSQTCNSDQSVCQEKQENTERYELNQANHSANRELPKSRLLLVDSREIAGGKDIISLLRLTHNIQTVLMHITAADFIVSTRVGVERIQMAEISSTHNKSRLLDKLCHLCEFYEQPYVIVEKQSSTGINSMNRSKNMDSVFSFLVQTHIKVLHSNSQEETATLLSELLQLEHKKGFAIQLPNCLTSKTEQIFHFYHSMPQVSTICALNFTYGFSTISQFVSSSRDIIQKVGSMATSKTSIVHNYLRAECQL